MIIIISGPKGSGKSTFANALAKSVWPQTVDVAESIPAKQPKYFFSLTIYTHQGESVFPQWLRDRTDYTVINIERLNSLTILTKTV
jgi:shikimate kinase